MKLWREAHLSNLPLLRPVFFFEGQTIQIGVELGDRNCDPILHLSVSFYDVPGALADGLNRVLPNSWGH